MQYTATKLQQVERPGVQGCWLMKECWLLKRLYLRTRARELRELPKKNPSARRIKMSKERQEQDRGSTFHAQLGHEQMVFDIFSTEFFRWEDQSAACLQKALQRLRWMQPNIARQPPLSVWHSWCLLNTLPMSDILAVWYPFCSIFCINLFWGWNLSSSGYCGGAVKQSSNRGPQILTLWFWQ